MAGLSSISGLVAGFDTKGAVDELLAARRVQIDNLNAKKDRVLARQDALATLNAAMLDLKNTALNLSDPSTFYSYTATLASSNPSVPASSLIDVSGTTGLAAGAHTIVVQQLAQAQREASSAAVQDSTGAAAASDTQALGLSGSFQVNGATITVQAGDSLRDIAAAINQANSGSNPTGVTATIIKSAAGDYRLVLTSDATGATGFTLTGADLDAGGPLAGLNLGSAGQTNARQTLQTPQDAVITLDGLTVTRSSNKISDALAGVTIDLKQADPNTTITMDINVDREAVRASVQSFVDQFNAVQDFINEQFKFDEKTGTGGVLAGDPLLTSIQRALTDSLMATVPGLAPDRNSLVKIGVEPDAQGHLQINPDLFDSFLNTDVDAIRDVFVASGTSNNDLLSYITSQNSPSGTYSVNITQPATRAAVTGTTDLVAGTLASAETVTITTGAGAQAVVALTAGMNQQQVIDALNAEFAKSYTETHQLSAALTAGGQPATGSTTFAQLGLGVAAGDTITIGGTTRSGASVNASFTILDPATDTLGDLLTTINQAFGQQATAAIDASGHITLTENQSGASQLSLALTANNEGGGTLDFGTDTVVTEGRSALRLEALAAGTGVRIQARDYGSAYSFSISQSVDGLGIPNQTASGQDVAGTINGLAATGSGQLLTGTTGDVNGLVVMYQGSATGAVGDISLGVGIAASYRGLLDMFANPVVGLINQAVQAEQSVADAIDAQISDLERQLAIKREQLTKSFARMEEAMALFQSTGDYLTAQIDAMNAKNN